MRLCVRLTPHCQMSQPWVVNSLELRFHTLGVIFDNKAPSLNNTYAHILLPSSSIPEGVVTQLKSSNWRERLESMERVHSCLRGSPIDSPALAQSFLRYLLQPPGLKDANVQVGQLCSSLNELSMDDC